MTDRLRAASALIGQRRILFAHQSVGANILDGLTDLEKEIGASIPVTGFDAFQPWTGIASARLGRNGDPRSKTEAFALAVEQSSPALALQKYCYVDLLREEDAKSLFDFYRDRIMRLSATHPATVIAHITVPLTAVEDSAKAVIKRLFGRARDHAAHNLARETFNALMRASFAPDTIFDLAALESSTDPRALRADFTADGGHLNERGRRQIAEAFVEFLARAVSI